MKKIKSHGARRLKGLWRDIRKLPDNLTSNMPARRKNAQITLLCLILAILVVGLGAYAVNWYANQNRIQNDARRYRQMYVDGLSAAATPAPTLTPTPSAAHTPEETMPPMETLQPDETLAPLATPDEHTLVYALPTSPPVQSSFAELLMHNADTVGYLDIGETISLPVVQRENDNEYYLTHNFDGEESQEGTLFLDGANRLVPEDDCLIVYGRNMKNDTMFGLLEEYENERFLKEHAIVRFDTIYENRSYVPFAAFTASMEPDDSHYFDVRQFVFDETGFELFTLKMQSRSIYDIPIDVCYGDRLLLLVTCDYTNASGRFILCLRQLREDESEDAMRTRVGQAQKN